MRRIFCRPSVSTAALTDLFTVLLYSKNPKKKKKTIFFGIRLLDVACAFASVTLWGLARFGKEVPALNY